MASPISSAKPPIAIRHQDAAPDSVADRLHVLGDAYRAHLAAVVGDRDGRVEEILVERCAVPRALSPSARKRRPDLGSRPVRADGLDRTGGVGHQSPEPVDHDHARTELGGGIAHELPQLFWVSHPAGGRSRDDECLRGRVVLDLGVDPARKVQRERHLERHQDQQRDVPERDEQPEAKAHSSSSAEAKRKPTPRTVWR
jgi:hypothetical protein